MKNNKRNIKTKNNLNQFIIAVTIIILSILIGYITKENELSEDVSNYNTKTNIINDTNINDIPEYSGEIVITINNDIPYFEEKDISNEDFEYYSNLDELGRAGVAFANICKYTMPPKDTKRGSLSYKPTGWEQYLYGENNSKHLYERCHLIAWQLGNENNNKRNLLTGTSQMNSAMIEYENIVANWIKLKNKENKDYHVLYRVTPIYKGENKLATGIEIEAKSVEEEGVSFNKFIYNIQDNFEIDYGTGKAKLIE
jgi:DNA-entry nuclease